MKTIQLTLTQLENILNKAKDAKECNSSLSNTVIITVLKETESHTGGDQIRVEIANSYSDCNGTIIY